MKYFVLDVKSQRIFLTENFNNEFHLLTSVEIYSIFVRNTGPYVNYEKDSSLDGLSYKKKTLDLKYKINLKAKMSLIDFYLLSDERLSSLEVNEVLKRGYYIVNSIWHPISQDSIKACLEIHKMMDSDSRIETNLAVRLSTDNIAPFKIQDSRNILNVFLEQEDDIAKDTTNLFVRELYDYQKRGVAWLKFCVSNKIGTILGDDMGLGKTAQIIALCSWLIERGLTKKILIVVPSTLLENWRREFEFFAPSIIPCMHHGHLRIGLAREFSSFEVVITSYSLVINDYYILNDVKWDLTILDEASLIKNPESERTRKIKELNSQVRIAMTGTPVENSLIDLWSLVDFCYPDFFPNLADFKQMYVGNSVSDTLNIDLENLRELTSMIMLRRMKIDILTSLPDKIDIHQALSMSDYEKIEYERIRLEIINSASSGQEACFKLINDLRQFTTHPLLISPEENQGERILKAKRLSVKFERTIEILDEIKAKGEKVLIFTGFISMIDLFKEYISEKYNIEVFGIDGRVETIERQKQIDKFSQTIGFSVMILNPTTAAMGLNITAANHVIHYTRQWNPAIEIQASARAYRNGQKKGVNIYYLYYIQTIEQVMDQRLREKEALSGEVIEVVEHCENEMLEMLNFLKNTII